MPGAKPDEPLELAYARPAEPRERPPEPLWPVVLCLPGLICWIQFLAMLLPRWLPVRPPRIFFGSHLLACWMLAVLSALVSLASYGRRPKAWYVWVNLVINVAGLLFTLTVLVVVLVLMATHM